MATSPKQHTDGQRAHKELHTTSHEGNAAQNQRRPHCTHENGHHQKQERERTLGGRTSHTLLVRMEEGTAGLENGLTVPPI